MKIEVVASKKKPERLKLSGSAKTAVVAGVVGLLGVAGAFGGGNVSALSLHDSMVANPVYQKYMQDLTVGNGSNWKLIPNKYIYTGEYGGKGSDSALPSNYSLIDEGYGTTLKNQGTDGDCWAFATTTAIESNFKKTQGVDVELSPKQMDYLLASGSPYYKFLNGNFSVERSLGDGGSFALASFPIGGQATPVTESSFFEQLKANDTSLANYSSWRHFQDVNTMSNKIFGDGQPYTKEMDSNRVMAGENDFVVTKYRTYQGDTDLIETIKENVYKYGAAYVGTTGPETEGCWDAATKTVVDHGAETCAEAGHAMAIVGWDDNHVYTDPADNSRKTGAFLLQNSWGKTSLWSDYGQTSDTIINLIDTSQMTEQQISELKTELQDFIDDYDSLEYVWLGYDFDDSADTGWVDFASIQETKAYAYDNVYDSFNQVEGLGADGADGTNSTYIFSTKNGDEYIDAISVATHLAAYDADVEYVVYVDNTGTGNGYEKVGSVIIPKGETGQETVELSTPVKVSDIFKVKVEGVALGRVQSFGDEDLLLRSVSVYTVDDIAVPNTGAPDTGLFTGESGFSKFGGVVAVAGAIATGLAGYAVYKNRKHLFRKVGFNKKGF